jgi:hypothetical protein
MLWRPHYALFFDGGLTMSAGLHRILACTEQVLLHGDNVAQDFPPPNRVVDLIRRRANLVEGRHPASDRVLDSTHSNPLDSDSDSDSTTWILQNGGLSSSIERRRDDR